jgi:arylsulfatase A-like enzyme
MRPLLRALPILTLSLAAIDADWARFEQPHRALELGLYLQAVLLWLAFGALVLFPARLTLAAMGRRRPGSTVREDQARAVAVLLAWMALPVLAHDILDRYAGLIGELSRLRTARPWIELALALALGLGVTWALRRALARLHARAVAVGAALVAILCGLFLAPGAAPEPPPARADARGKPNVLLLVWDTCRSDSLTPYGCARDTTPHLARFAEQAIRWQEARSASVFTLTSHLSLLTGVPPSVHGARLGRNRYNPRRAPSVAETFRAAGYRTGAFVGTDVLSARTGIRSGFVTYDDRVDPAVCDTRLWKLVHDLQAMAARLMPALRNDGRPHWWQDFQRPASVVLARAREWIERDDERPWFCFVNLYDVHWPYVPGAEGSTRFVRPYAGPMDGHLFRSDDWVAGYEPDEADRAHVLDLYQAELFELDREVGVFLEALALTDGGTAVLMTSDHGEAFGEAGRWSHEDILEPQTRVPLLVRRAEPSPRGEVSADPASGIDVAPTLCGLAGLEPPKGVRGVNLLDGTGARERTLLIEDRDHVDARDVRIALYRAAWKLARFGFPPAARYELYDLAEDELGVRDVSQEHGQVRADLQALLDAVRAGADVEESAALPPAAGSGVNPDALQGLGYTGE